ncbi:pyruvate/2-oxoglutarate dehydrogenase complex dihydrolipoamide dehydrogenase (E3) component [Microbacteriaceae bacterium SG_E_30_P1]|uniref:Pyruvate/2-oxoglutarate dehydrogenase complex dihydrolipoamide dehydrogenase (E3) component n=1 Tax=Antiquaquibacter oligotrophicus TaxID=2880260 RepID=A0ABT6KKL8_9MICO|nr:NAD(P)/FAD-dependent oxidoreductase [Antiquaquibacter oligotrophicus]MDH6180530.1 pyruvate/2-oxoglutarate dehydrogenase complex dihydrolipoamide dehydrogenase (E3) component [Antiquaquibacter oligotrophicus]UDF13736.1 NAD(P)/FAD-dependent oxidoreductase [Antiquaquibacter oligotrophicus]
MSDEYDVIVIGAGAVGENVADRAVQGGLTAVLIESELVGGECSYWACMPSKALIRSGSALRAAQRLEGAREAVTGALDASAVLHRRSRIVHDWDDSSQVEWVDGAGISLVRGHGRIVGERTVEVTDSSGTTTTLRARQAVVVSTGSDPLLPDIPGLLDANPWTARDATSAKVVPPSLAIIGGGVVAVEMATAYASFGTTVTVFARSGLLSHEEDFAGEMVADGLRELGVDIRSTSPSRVERTDAGVVLHSDGDPVTASEVLVATGRVPRTTDIGLESVGLKPGEWIEVDDTLRVPGIDWLYATGDVNHRALLTHQGKYQARAAGDVIAARAKGAEVDDAPWGRHVATADHLAVPQVTFSDPEVASVGLTSTRAEKEGLRVRTVDYDLSWVAGATIQADHYRGKARMVVDEDRKVIVGVTFVGQDVSELVQAATMAIVGEIPLDRLWHAVPAYPTLSEIWLRLLETYGRDS